MTLLDQPQQQPGFDWSSLFAPIAPSPTAGGAVGATSQPGTHTASTTTAAPGANPDLQAILNFAHAQLQTQQGGTHKGIGGGEITPGNPSGNPANPWGAGGFFDNNPVHRAAVAQQQIPLPAELAANDFTRQANNPVDWSKLFHQ